MSLTNNNKGKARPTVLGRALNS